MPCKRLQPSFRPSANSLTLVPSGTTEYIAAGDSQATFPFPMEIGRDFDLQWKMASGLSCILLQLAVTAGKWAFRRRALRRPHPARREVTCGDTDMDWPRLGAVLHMTGLWGRSYLGVGRRTTSRTWQKLCQREDTGLCICAMLLRDTAMLRLDLPPPRAVLAGSPPDRGRAWWDPWARIQAGVSRQRESRPTRSHGTLRLPKMPGGPRPVWWKWAR